MSDQHYSSGDDTDIDLNRQKSVKRISKEPLGHGRGEWASGPCPAEQEGERRRPGVRSTRLRGDQLTRVIHRGRKVACETLDDSRRGVLDREIMKIMEGRDTAESTDIARVAVASLRATKVDGIILGYGDPLLLRTTTEADLIDPLQLLAEAAVKLAIA